MLVHVLIGVPRPDKVTGDTKVVTYQEGVEAFRVTERLSASDKAALMGESLTRVYHWAPSPEKSSRYASASATIWHTYAMIVHRVECHAWVIIRLGHKGLKIPRLCVYQGKGPVHPWWSLTTGA